MLHRCMFPACCFRQRYMVKGLVHGVFNETWTHSFAVIYTYIYIYRGLGRGRMWECVCVLLEECWRCWRMKRIRLSKFYRTKLTLFPFRTEQFNRINSILKNISPPTLTLQVSLKHFFMPRQRKCRVYTEFFFRPPNFVLLTTDTPAM